MAESNWNRIHVNMLPSHQHHSITFTDDVHTMMTKLPTFDECGFKIEKKELEKTYDPTSMYNMKVKSPPNDTEDIKSLVPVWIEEFIGTYFPKKAFTFVLFQCGSLAVVLQDNIDENSTLFSFMCDYTAPAHRIMDKKTLRDIFVFNELWWIDYIKSHSKREIATADFALRALTECYPLPGSYTAAADTFAMWKKTGEDCYLATCGLACSNKVFVVTGTKKLEDWAFSKE